MSSVPKMKPAPGAWRDEDVPAVGARVDGGVGGRRGVGLDLDGEAEGVEVLLDLGSHALDLLVVGGAHDNRAGGGAGLLEQRLGLVGVGGVDRGGLVVVGEGLGQVAAGGRGEAGKGVADDLVVVDGIHDSLAQLDVIPLLLGDVEHDEAGAEALDVVDLAARALECVDGVGRDELHDLGGALLLLGEAGGAVGHDVEVELLVLGLELSVVVGVGDEVERLVGHGVVHPRA